MSTKKIRVLFVCLGNICRSPTADGVFQRVVENAKLSHLISVDSAGTSGWHIGEKPDARSSAEAATRGYDLTNLRGRQFTAEDFKDFDYILAMDNQNLMDIEALAPSQYEGHLGLFLSFSKQSDYKEVPDPYHGGKKGFTLVLDLIEDASHGLLNHIKEHNL